MVVCLSVSLEPHIESQMTYVESFGVVVAWAVRRIFLRVSRFWGHLVVCPTNRRVDYARVQSAPQQHTNTSFRDLRAGKIRQDNCSMHWRAPPSQCL